MNNTTYLKQLHYQLKKFSKVISKDKSLKDQAIERQQKRRN